MRASASATASALHVADGADIGDATSAKRDPIVRSSALAVSSESRGRATTMMKCCGVVMYSEYVRRAAIAGGIQTVALPLSPANGAGRTPMIVSGTSLIRIVLPTAEGSA